MKVYNHMSIKNRQTGLSLIELMIAMTLSLILLTGVVQLFIGNKKSFDITRDLSDLQENGRMGLTFIGESLRMADFWGTVPSADVDLGSVTVTGATASVCNSAWVLSAGNGIQGFEGGTTPPIDCLLDGRYLDNTDVLVVRYADSGRMVPEPSLGTDASLDDDILVRVLTSLEAEVFVGASAGTAQASIPFDDGVSTYPFVTELYYLRACSVLNNATPATCANSADPTPTLVRMTIQDGAWVEQPLVEGIEQMQFEYGIDATPITNAEDILTVDSYVGVAGVTDWERVVSVRMSLVARALDGDSEYTETRTFNLAGNHTYTVAAADQSYRRKQYDREVNLRNRSRL